MKDRIQEINLEISKLLKKKSNPKKTGITTSRIERASYKEETTTYDLQGSD